MLGIVGVRSDQHYSDLIVQLVKLMGCESFLELGVYTGVVSAKVFPFVKRLVGVDIIDIRTEKLGEFFLGTTDKFFESRYHDKSRIDMIFIDADHGFESVRRDFEDSLRILAPYGMIIIHDTDPISSEFAGPGFCSDAYKVIDYIRNEHDDLDVLTLPISEAGMTLVTRKLDRRVYNYL